MIGFKVIILKRIETYPDLKRKRQACKEQTESGTDQTLLGPLEGG